MFPSLESSIPAAALVAAGMLLASPALAMEMGDGADAHAHHHHDMNAMTRATRSTAVVQVPDVQLVRDDGQAVSLPAELDDDRPVLVNFVYTTCTTICPVMTQIFSQVQAKVGGERVRMVSISIDPEQDTPKRLAEYARKFHAGASWHFYTGTAEASVAAQRAFGVYRGDKMDHTPVTLLRAAHGKSWVRIDGFASSDELAGEVRELLAAR